MGMVPFGPKIGMISVRQSFSLFTSPFLSRLHLLRHSREFIVSQNKNTLSVHAGRIPGSRAIVNAIEPASAFRYLDGGEQNYPRYFNTPNQKVIVDKLCALESAPAGLLFGSGMAAISTTLLSLLRPGDHAVFQNGIYGGTHSFITNEFDEAGISYSFAAGDLPSLLSATNENTRVVYVETPGNPLLDVVDLKGLAIESKSRNWTTVVDNTFATPINQNPFELGIDVVLHSGTKYLGGHSDLCFGAVVSRDDLVQEIYKKAVRFGGSVNGMTCYLIERSIKTLAVRVERQNENGQQIAEFLEKHRLVDRVNYPGLPSHPGHTIAAQQMSGFGGMISFELSKDISSIEFLKALNLIEPAMSLGGIESTVTIPAITSHRAMSEEARDKQGIGNQLVRLSIGIEAAKDLIDDLQTTLDSFLDGSNTDTTKELIN